MNEKASKVVEAARSQLGGPYVFGAWGSECTPSMRRKYAGYNPQYEPNIRKACPVLSGKQSSCEGCKWKGALAFDCRGFTHWALLQVGIKIDGGGATTQYNTKANWTQRGTIDAMPDLVCCVFKQRDGKMQHTGLHIGGGKIIHCSTTVKEGKTTDKGWTHYAVPAGLYDGQETTTAEPVKVLATLRKGSQGSAVSALQTMLNRLGFDSGKVDGIYGTKTMAAVRSFQEANGLTVDGIAGEQTLTTLAIRAATLDSVPATPVTYTLTISGLDADTAARLMAEFPQAVKV
jgi:hypothetical protein